MLITPVYKLLINNLLKTCFSIPNDCIFTTVLKKAGNAFGKRVVLKYVVNVNFKLTWQKFEFYFNVKIKIESVPKIR